MEIKSMQKRIKELKNDVKDIDGMIKKKIGTLRQTVAIHNADVRSLQEDKKFVLGKIDGFNELIKLEKAEKEKDGE